MLRQPAVGLLIALLIDFSKGQQLVAEQIMVLNSTLNVVFPRRPAIDLYIKTAAAVGPLIYV